MFVLEWPGVNTSEREGIRSGIGEKVWGGLTHPELLNTEPELQSPLDALRARPL